MCNLIPKKLRGALMAIDQEVIVGRS
jgi:hypothetical protein